MLKKKHPSPEVKPAIQKGLGIFCVCTISLPFGFTLGNASRNFLDNPRFIDALIATIFCNPSKVKCSLRCTKVTTSRNNK
jgi:hypothetical protein